MVAPKTLKRTGAFPSRHIKMLVPAWSPSGRCALASALSPIERMTRSSGNAVYRGVERTGHGAPVDRTPALPVLPGEFVTYR
jgi:hypothetical protein